MVPPGLIGERAPVAMGSTDNSGSPPVIHPCYLITRNETRIMRSTCPDRVLRLAAVLAASLLAACSSSPPKTVENACSIFEEKDDWYEAMRAAEKKWGTPIQIQLAIMRQESGFRHDARPPRDKLLGVPMWWRVSDAYGFAQAKDDTWDWYESDTGRWSADRDDFEDAADFIGWYTDVSQRTLGISKWDAYNQYLAYHEGHGGWKRRTYKGKPWLVRVARKVDGYAHTYGAQLKQCRDRLDKGQGWW